VLIGGVLLGLTRREVRARYDEIVAFSGLPTEALDRRLASYSAGMGLRLGFSLVVHARPDVLLVDEVLAVGDDAFQRQCLARLDRLRADGCSVIIVSHDMALVRERCDEVALLDAGRLVALDRPEVAIARHLDRGEAPGLVPAERRLYEVPGRTRASRRLRGAS
jgi:ABC-type polysaccharide/polyol phosphate transport system ATPase subunit